jgi:CRP-like cAMP-binding protein
VYAQGDPAEAVFYLQKGIAKKTVTSVTGKDALLTIVEPGDFFGEGCLHRRLGHRFITVTALTDCSAIRIEKPAMARALREDPNFSELFINHLLRRNSRNVDELVNQIFNSSEMRLARTLLLLANFYKAEKPDALRKMSQETLAAMVGTTRSRVSFFMNKFRRLGLIDYTGNGLDLRVNAALLDKVLQEGACAELVLDLADAAPSQRAASA